MFRLWRVLQCVAAAANQPIDAIGYSEDRKSRARDRSRHSAVMATISAVVITIAGVVIMILS
jgi:hypothetical protein